MCRVHSEDKMFVHRLFFSRSAAVHVKHVVVLEASCTEKVTQLACCHDR